MKDITMEYVEKKLREECMTAPLSIGKIVRVFSYCEYTMHKVLNMYHQGLLVNYHMMAGDE